MFTVGQLAKRYGLSRSALLYYDNKGGLSPSQRTQANYRLYSNDDVAKLERISLFRNAGMPLDDIAQLIDKTSDEIERAMENRLFSINKEIQSLRKQQGVIIDVLRNQGKIKHTRIVTKDIWVSMLAAAGLDEEGMMNWHKAFEQNSPEAHQDFLESIGIDTNEIAKIRQLSQQ